MKKRKTQSKGTRLFNMQDHKRMSRLNINKSLDKKFGEGYKSIHIVLKGKRWT